MKLIKIDRPYFIIRMSQVQAAALKAVFEALLPQLKRYESIKFISKLDTQLKQMLQLFEDTKLEGIKQEPIIKAGKKDEPL